MSPLSKSVLASLAIFAVIGGTLALRGRSTSAAVHLTPAQLAEIAPVQKPERPSLSVHPVNDPSDLPPPPQDEPELEDGDGS